MLLRAEAVSSATLLESHLNVGLLFSSIDGVLLKTTCLDIENDSGFARAPVSEFCKVTKITSVEIF